VWTGATFRLSGVGGAAPVTRSLGLEPSYAAEVGDPVGRTTATVRRTSLWTLSSDLSADRELAEHLTWLLDRLEPVRDTLWLLVAEGYVADWFCLAASQAAEHAVELDRPLLHRLLTLPGDLLLDVMGDE
jgi:hypothetical protein